MVAVNDCTCFTVDSRGILATCTCGNECTCQGCGCDECEGGSMNFQCACGGNCACNSGV